MLNVKSIKERITNMAIMTAVMFFSLQKRALAGSLEDTKLVTGTQELLDDVATVIMILAVPAGVALLSYFLFRKNGADEMDQKKWDTRMKISVGATIAIFLVSGTLKALLSYYQ